MNEAQFTLGTKANIFFILPFLECAFSYCGSSKIYRTEARVGHSGRGTKLLTPGLRLKLSFGARSTCISTWTSHQKTTISIGEKTCSKEEGHFTKVLLCVY